MAHFAAEFLFKKALFAEAEKSTSFDITCLDIYMPGEDGIDIARRLREISLETGIVFVTTSEKNAIEAFSVYALYYLVKPGDPRDYRGLWHLDELRLQKRERITFPSGSNRYTLFLNQIYLLESNKHRVNVSLSDRRRLNIRMSFRELKMRTGQNF